MPRIHSDCRHEEVKDIMGGGERIGEGGGGGGEEEGVREE